MINKNENDCEFLKSYSKLTENVIKDVYMKLSQGMNLDYIFMNLKENGNKIWLTKQSKRPTIA